MSRQTSYEKEVTIQNWRNQPIATLLELTRPFHHGELTSVLRTHTHYPPVSFSRDVSGLIKMQIGDVWALLEVHELSDALHKLVRA